MGIFRDTHFIPQKSTNPQSKSTEKARFLAIYCLKDKEVEKLEDHGSPKVKDLLDEEMWICSSFAIRHKTTLHCAERKAKLSGNWIMQLPKLYHCCCDLYC